MKKKKKKKGPVKLDSDCDFLEAFKKKEPVYRKSEIQQKKPLKDQSLKDRKLTNKHGLPVLDNFVKQGNPQDHSGEDEFEILLENSFRHKRERSIHNRKSFPLKKRIKRYPPVEKTLDLHGQTSNKALMKARSFIQSHKQRGYFTLKIIVGRGSHSQMGPVLPDVVEDLLIVMKKEGTVLGYEWDKKEKSKSGSIVVYLRQFEQYE